MKYSNLPNRKSIVSGLIALTITSFFTVYFYSCEDQLETIAPTNSVSQTINTEISNDLIVKNGIVFFKDKNTLKKIGSEFQKNPENFKLNNFDSFENYENELEKNDDNETNLHALRKNGTIPIIYSQFLKKILNKDGVVAIGDTIYKITANNVLSINKNQFNPSSLSANSPNVKVSKIYSEIKKFNPQNSSVNSSITTNSQSNRFGCSVYNDGNDRIEVGMIYSNINYWFYGEVCLMIIPYHVYRGRTWFYSMWKEEEWTLTNSSDYVRLQVTNLKFTRGEGSEGPYSYDKTSKSKITLTIPVYYNTIVLERGGFIEYSANTGGCTPNNSYWRIDI